MSVARSIVCIRCRQTNRVPTDRMAAEARGGDSSDVRPYQIIA
jgi:hypothetical protein